LLLDRSLDDSDQLLTGQRVVRRTHLRHRFLLLLLSLSSMQISNASARNSEMRTNRSDAPCVTYPTTHGRSPGLSHAPVNRPASSVCSLTTQREAGARNSRRRPATAPTATTTASKSGTMTNA